MEDSICPSPNSICPFCWETGNGLLFFEKEKDLGENGEKAGCRPGNIFDDVCGGSTIKRASRLSPSSSASSISKSIIRVVSLSKDGSIPLSTAPSVKLSGTKTSNLHNRESLQSEQTNYHASYYIIVSVSLSSCQNATGI